MTTMHHSALLSFGCFDAATGLVPAWLFDDFAVGLALGFSAGRWARADCGSGIANGFVFIVILTTFRLAEIGWRSIGTIFEKGLREKMHVSASG
jgi:hypothetical protein